jgi:hypothetical protein
MVKDYEDPNIIPISLSMAKGGIPPTKINT